MALAPPWPEAEDDAEVEVAVTGGGATLWPGSLGLGSWWVLVDCVPPCEPGFVILGSPVCRRGRGFGPFLGGLLLVREVLP